MLLYLIFSLIYLITVTLTSWLPSAATLPFGLDTIVLSMYQGLQTIITVFPPLSVVLTAFLIYAGFRLGLMFFRILIGHRAPDLN